MKQMYILFLLLIQMVIYIPGSMIGGGEKIAKLIYQDVNTETNLGFLYKHKYLDTVKLRLLKGGIRLASILDDIFKK